MSKRNRIITHLTMFVVLLFMVFFSGFSTFAEKFPDKDITIIVPYNVGGATDIYVRTVAKAMDEMLDVDVLITNITGGQSVPAFNALQKEPADGYTMLAIGDGDLINTVMGRYDYKKITPICVAQRDQCVFWVAKDSPFKDLNDVIQDAKENPGRQKWTGGLQFEEIAVAIFTNTIGIDVLYAPYADSTQANAALAGGFYDAGHEELGPMLGLYTADKVRPIAVLSEERLPSYPEIPTALEYGFDLTLGRWRGLGVKYGTPNEIVRELENIVEEALETEAYKELTKRTVTDQRPGFTPSEGTQEMMDELFESYKEVMTELGMVE